MATTGSRPPSGTHWAKQWRALAEQAIGDLADGWALAGKGGKTRLAVGPVRWWLSTVGFNAGRSGSGDLFAAHQPLTVPWTPNLTLTQQEVQGDDKPRADFDPWDDDAGFVFRWWVTGPAAECFAEHTEAEWVAIREKTFELARDRRPYSWPMLAGFRVIYETGPAEPVIDAVLQAIADDLYYDNQKPWWEEFRSVVTGKPRAEVLRWLDARRRDSLAAAGVPESEIADVLDGVG